MDYEQALKHLGFYLYYLMDQGVTPNDSIARMAADITIFRQNDALVEEVVDEYHESKS